MSQDKIEIIIDKYPNGSEIELSSMSLEATKILLDIIEALSKIVEAEGNPDIKIGITSGSACLRIDNASVVYENFLRVANNDDSRKNEYVSNMQVVQHIINNSDYGIKVNLTSDNTVTPIINLFDKKFRQKRERKVIKNNYKVEFFKGKLYESGGKTPNFHIEQSNTKYKIYCNEHNAIEVGKFLYKDIKFSAWGKLNSNNRMIYEFCDIYNANDYDFYSDFKSFIRVNNNLEGTEPLKHIHYKLKSYYSEGKFKESRKFLKLFCNEIADVNRLRAILLISKKFREHRDISDLILKIEDLIKQKTKREIL